jgi:WD40 repeat protein
MRHKRLIGVIGVLILVIAACGDDGGDPSAPQAATPADPAPHELLRMNVDDARAIAYSPDGKQVAIANGNTIWLYTADFELVRALTGHTGTVHGLAWSPDGSQLASASLDQTARVWNPATGETLRILSGHQNWVFTVAWSPDGSRLATGSTDRSVRLWEADSGALRRVLGATQVASFTLALQDQTIPRLITELETAERTASQLAGVTAGDDAQRLKDARDTISRINSRDDAALIAAMRKLKADRFTLNIQIADPATNDELSAMTDAALVDLIREMGAVEFMARAADDRFILSTELDENDMAAILDAARRTTVTIAILRENRGHDNSVTAVAWSGAILASASADSTIRLWDVNTYALLGTLDGHQDSITSLAWSLDGARLASGGWDNTAKLWDMSKGSMLLRNWTPTGHAARDRVGLPDGAYSPPAPRRTIRCGYGHGDERAASTRTGGTRALGWSPDGARLISSAMDGTVRVWDATALLGE